MSCLLRVLIALCFRHGFSRSDGSPSAPWDRRLPSWERGAGALSIRRISRLVTIGLPCGLAGIGCNFYAGDFLSIRNVLETALFFGCRDNLHAKTLFRSNREELSGSKMSTRSAYDLRIRVSPRLQMLGFTRLRVLHGSVFSISKENGPPCFAFFG